MALGLGHSTHQRLRPGHNTIVSRDYYMQITHRPEGPLARAPPHAVFN